MIGQCVNNAVYRNFVITVQLQQTNYIPKLSELFLSKIVN